MILGTGKTTTARKMGQVYYDMGFLSSTEVVECSTSDLIAEFVGQTGPKTKKLLEKALGRVLFIDEAYRLGEGHFAKEAVDELVSNLTVERFRGKIVVILAGYDNEINRMLDVNPGLNSRFTEEIIFTNIPIPQCFELLRNELSKKQIHSDALINPSSAHYQEVEALLIELASMSSWGNGRDLIELAKQMIKHVFTSPTLRPDSDGNTTLPGEDVVVCIQGMLAQKKGRSTSPSATRSSHLHQHLPTQSQGPRVPPAPPNIQTKTQTKAAPPKPEDEDEDGSSGSNRGVRRDPGVSDEDWNELQAAKQAEEMQKKREEEERRKVEEELKEALRKEQEAAEAVRKVLAAEKAAKDEEERKELMKQREMARLREIQMREEQDRLRKIREAQRIEQEKKLKEEAELQRKVQRMGRCPAGYRWIAVGGGYRCEAGGHYVSGAGLGF